MVVVGVLAVGRDTDPPPTVGPPPSGLVATLEDEVSPAGASATSWRTFWKLCWDAYPGAVAYELRALTGEGAARTVRRQPDRCLRVEAAAGEGADDERPARRAMLLATQRSQLAYQVRAVRGDGSRTGWTDAVAVGSES